MTIEFTNDELFVLCAIGGRSEVVGVANNFIAMDKDETYSKINEITQLLESNGHIYRNAEGYGLTEQSERIVDFISDSDETYIISDDENENYLFVKETAMHMKNVECENCRMEFFDSRDEMKDYFRSEFDFFKVHTDSVQYMLSISSDVLDKAIGKAEEGYFDDAVRILDGDDFEKDEIQNMLKSVIFPEVYRIVICRKKSNAGDSESVYKICGTEKGSWIVRISTCDEGANTIVYKVTDDDITKIFFEV